MVLNIPYLFTLSLVRCSLLDQTSPESLYSLWWDAHSWTKHLHPCTLSGWMLLLFLCLVSNWMIWRFGNFLLIILIYKLNIFICYIYWYNYVVMVTSQYACGGQRTTCGGSCSPCAMPSLGIRWLCLLRHPVRASESGGSFDLWKFSVF